MLCYLENKLYCCLRGNLLLIHIVIGYILCMCIMPYASCIIYGAPSGPDRVISRLKTFLLRPPSRSCDDFQRAYYFFVWLIVIVIMLREFFSHKKNNFIRTNMQRQHRNNAIIFLILPQSAVHNFYHSSQLVEVKIALI